ncbi:class I lanthipeptide [Spirosoma gilvum]
MKKQISKIALKTDQIVTMSKTDARQIQGGQKPQTGLKCDPYSNTRCTVCTWM